MDSQHNNVHEEAQAMKSNLSGTTTWRLFRDGRFTLIECVSR